MEKKNEFTPVKLPETKEMYEAPVIEVVEVRVERGFEDSLSGNPLDNPTF